MQILSEKDLVEAYNASQVVNGESDASAPLYYLNYLPVSATYYSNGNAARISAVEVGAQENEFWLAVHKTDGDSSPLGL